MYTYTVNMYMFTCTHTLTYCVIFPHSSERVTTLEVHISTVLYMFVYSTYLEPLIWSNQIYPITFVTYLLISLRLR